LATRTVTHNTNWKGTFNSMLSHRKNKLSGWTIDLIKKFPKVVSLKDFTFIGSFAWTQPHIKNKMIKSTHAHNYGAGWVTPADIARDYLAVKFGGERLRCNTNQYIDFVKNRIHQPLYCEPVTGMRAVYVDLKSAYWQILMCGGWDVDYSRNRFLSVRSDVLDFPFPHLKLARNTLISIGLPGNSTTWHPEHGFSSMRGGGATINLVLYGFAMDFLHCFAEEMIERAGAVYVNTDGYIIPEFELTNALKIADEWGVQLDLRYDGFATVRRVGDYDIANYRSSRPSVGVHPRKYIHPPKLKWFKKRWNHFSHRIDMNYAPLLSDMQLTGK